MNKTIITVLASSILLMLTFLSANEKPKKSDDFLRINDNIQNDELRSELETLRNEFQIERERIHTYYMEKIKTILL